MDVLSPFIPVLCHSMTALLQMSEYHQAEISKIFLVFTFSHWIQGHKMIKFSMIFLYLTYKTSQVSTSHYYPVVTCMQYLLRCCASLVYDVAVKAASQI